MPPLLGRVALALALGLMAGGCASQPSAFSSMRRSSLPGNRPSGLSSALSDLTSGRKPPAAPGPDSVSGGAAQGDPVQGPLALARLSERRGQPAQAEQLYRVVMERDPQNPAPYHRLGVMRAKEGRFKEADELFAEALRRAPSDLNLLCDVGYSYYLQHRLEESEQVLRRALELKPQDERVCNNLAAVLGDQGRYPEALVLFQRVGSQAQASANLGFVYTQRGEIEKAKDAYARALAMDPNLRPAAEAMVQLSQYDRASATARTPARAEPRPAAAQVSEATARAPARVEPPPADAQVSEATARRPAATRVAIPAPSGPAAEPVRTATRQAVFDSRPAAARPPAGAETAQSAGGERWAGDRLRPPAVAEQNPQTSVASTGSADSAVFASAGFASADDRQSRSLVASRTRPENSSPQPWPTIKVPSPPPIAEGVSTLGQHPSVPMLGASAPGFPPPQPFPAVQSENLNPFVRW